MAMQLDVFERELIAPVVVLVTIRWMRMIAVGVGGNVESTFFEYRIALIFLLLWFGALIANTLRYAMNVSIICFVLGFDAALFFCFSSVVSRS